jgi:hypothetical protein
MNERYRFSTDAERLVYNEPEIPVLAGTYTGTVRIIGGGSSMWKDFQESEVLLQGTDVICVNIAGMVIPKAEHLFSWHKKQISAIKDFRMAEWPDDKSIVHSVSEYRNINWEWRFNGGTSVSGLSCIDLAYLLGYTRIALVGIPMDGNGYFYKPNDNVDMHDKWRHREVGRLKQVYDEKVKSFSGYTNEIFGHPKEWGNVSI